MTPALRATVADVTRHRCGPSYVVVQAETSHVQARASHLEAVDLFCGFGGVSEGLKRAGLNVALAVDLDARAVRSHRAWHPEIPVFRRDVSQVRPSDLAGRFVWASPSCRPYSMANTTGPRGMDHPEYFSLEHLFHLALGARVLVIENVPGLMWSKAGQAELKNLERACAALRVSLQVIEADAKEFGVPQSRRRVFLVIGAPLVMLSRDFRPGAVSHPTVTTHSSGDVSYLAAVQGLTNPLELNVPDWRSGRRSSRSQVPVAGVHTARRLVGNAIPPEMAQAVACGVLEALGVDS